MTVRPLTPEGAVLRTGGSSKLERAFDQAWDLLRPEGFPMPVLEYRFESKRRWRFDRAWPDESVAVEIEGGLYRHNKSVAGGPTGRHTSVTGFVNDCSKYNAAALAGWLVLRFTEKHLANPYDVADQVAAALRLRRRRT